MLLPANCGRLRFVPAGQAPANRTCLSCGEVFLTIDSCYALSHRIGPGRVTCAWYHDSCLYELCHASGIGRADYDRAYSAHRAWLSGGQPLIDKTAFEHHRRRNSDIQPR